MMGGPGFLEKLLLASHVHQPVVAADVRRRTRLESGQSASSRRRLQDFGRILNILVVAALCAISALRLSADAPTVEHLHPAGLARGSTNVVTIAGKFEPWPPKVWVSCPGVVLTAETNKGKFRVETAADAPVGAHWLRVFNADGPSLPRIFVVSRGTEVLEAEPNDHFTNAQPVTPLPMTVNGRLDKTGDVDSFAVTLKAGQWLDARLDAYTLASKMDALLRLVSPDGVQQTWNHDFGTLDPRLLWQAASNGTYVVQVMGFKHPADAELRLTGGDGCVYRLHLAVGPERPDVFGGIVGTAELEPNNSVTNAMVVALPASVRGVIGGAEDEDCFAFEVKKDESIEASIEAASIGSALDALLKITDATGKELARNDDASGSRDPRLEWKAPTNGTFCVVVGNLLHAGGTNHFYRLSLQRLAPDFKASLAAHSITVIAGETNEVKFTATRLRGFDRKLKARLKGLPDGLRAEPVDVSEKSGENTLKLIASADAKVAQVPLRLVITDVESGEERVALFALTSSSEDNGVPGGYTKLLVDSVGQLWLSLKAKPAAK